MHQFKSIWFWAKDATCGEVLKIRAKFTMFLNKKVHPTEKSKLHPQNKNRVRYDFRQLTSSLPELALFVKTNIYGDESIDFANPNAVKALNKALLINNYGLNNWDIPPGYLCPPVPGRADYIHHIAEFLGKNNFGKIPAGQKMKCLDIGIGAGCIYPIIGNHEYGWSFIGSDIDLAAIESSNKIIESNLTLAGKVQCKLQKNPQDIFVGIINESEMIDLSICNPPFHTSAIEAKAQAFRKIKNLNQGKIINPILNFGGQNHELWCEGGEEKFVRNMILQSKKFPSNCFWFSSLVSKAQNLKSIYKTLEQAKAVHFETIPMGQGNKLSRIVVWTFLSVEEQNKWKNSRWQ